MPVLVETLSVIVRIQTLEEKYPGGLDAYRANCPNGTFCSDNHLARIGFTTPYDVGQFMNPLMRLGLRFVEEGKSQEIVVVDQEDSPTMPCDWLKVGVHPDGFQYAALVGDLGDRVAKSDGWVLETSMTTTARKVSHETHDGMKWIRSEGPKEIYWDEDRQQEMVVYGSGSRNPLEAYRRRLVAKYGDGSRPLWAVSPNGRVVALGDRRVHDIPEFQLKVPMMTMVIGPIDGCSRSGLVDPLRRLGRRKRVPTSQKHAMV
jgi:hypothetical protein